MRLYHSPLAINDLVRLSAFIAQNNPQAANRIGTQLVQNINKLKAFPHLGRKVLQAPKPEMIRDLSIEQYIVRYLILENELPILRIWHKREDRPD